MLKVDFSLLQCIGLATFGVVDEIKFAVEWELWKLGENASSVSRQLDCSYSNQIKSNLQLTESRG